VSVPGSKSIANRALVCAALADGVTTLERLPDGDDTTAMVDCLARLGINVSVEGERAVVSGSGGELPPGPVVLPTRLAGTTSRFLTALAAAARGGSAGSSLGSLLQRLDFTGYYERRAGSAPR
jgi:3-phosphoshikimate 1-carboxyvinyltransferase